MLVMFPVKVYIHDYVGLPEGISSRFSGRIMIGPMLLLVTITLFGQDFSLNDGR